MAIRSYVATLSCNIPGDTNWTYIRQRKVAYYRIANSDSTFAYKKLLNYEEVIKEADSIVDCKTDLVKTVSHFKIFSACDPKTVRSSATMALRRLGKSEQGDMIFVATRPITEADNEYILIFISNIGSPYKCEALYVIDKRINCPYFIVNCFIE